MSFIQPNDHIILMDMFVRYEEPDHFLSLDDTKALFDAGIKTAYCCVNRWSNNEPMWGAYNWARIDKRVEELLQCGFKVAVNTTCDLPAYFPDEWYACTVNGRVKGAINIWNDDAMSYMLGYYKKLRSHFPDNVLVVNSFLTDGETAYLLEPAWIGDWSAINDHKRKNGCEPYAGGIETNNWLRASYIEALTKLQKVLITNPYREIWTQLHSQIGDFPGGLYAGCRWVEDFVASYRALGADVSIVHIYYTWVQWVNAWAKMNDTAARYGERVFGGAEYASGLPGTTPTAISQGIHGQIISPCHPYTGLIEIEPWMLDNIQTAVRLWEAVS